ncbi:MAG: hypothetical protein PUC30_09660 [Lachnospiraceae bacterium]|nr:hypothetical protein [Lachnospiraceae bacterium]
MNTKTSLLKKVKSYPEYREFRKEQRKNVVFYSVINILLCTISIIFPNGELRIFADFLFTAFVVSLAGLTLYTAKRPSIKRGIVSKKEQRGQTYHYTVINDKNHVICIYRTLKETPYRENDTVFVLNDNYLIKERG